MRLDAGSARANTRRACPNPWHFMHLKRSKTLPPFLSIPVPLQICSYLAQKWHFFRVQSNAFPNADLRRQMLTFKTQTQKKNVEFELRHGQQLFYLEPRRGMLQDLRMPYTDSLILNFRKEKPKRQDYTF